MNQEVKALWLAALRSGEYEQGKSRLRAGDTYCCLGVLCDIHRKAVGGDWTEPYKWGNSGVADYKYSVGGSSSRDVLPFSVREWAGLDSPNPRIEGIQIVDFNDGLEGMGEVEPIRSHTFAEIAALIERYL